MDLGRVSIYNIQQIQEKMDPETHGRFMRTNRFISQVCGSSSKWPHVYRQKLKIFSTHYVGVPFAKRSIVGDRRGYNIVQYTKGEYNEAWDKKDMKRLRVDHVLIDYHFLCDLDKVCRFFNSHTLLPMGSSVTVKSCNASALSFIHTTFKPDTIIVEQLNDWDISPILDISIILVLSNDYLNEKGIREFLGHWYSGNSQVQDFRLRKYDILTIDLENELLLFGFEFLWSRINHQMSIVGHLDIKKIKKNRTLLFKMQNPVTNRFAYVRMDEVYPIFEFFDMPSDFNFERAIYTDLEIME